jgi:hypothetical protein
MNQDKNAGQTVNKNKPLRHDYLHVLVFLLATAMAGVSLLIKYILIPGCEAWSKNGRQIELTWLGLDRQGWGEVQMYLSFLLLGLILLGVTIGISRPAARKIMASGLIMVLIGFLGLSILMPLRIIEVSPSIQAESTPECFAREFLREKAVPKKAKRQKRSDYWPKDNQKFIVVVD